MIYIDINAFWNKTPQNKMVINNIKFIIKCIILKKLKNT